MRATRLPRLHVITDTRGPIALDPSRNVTAPAAVSPAALPDPLAVIEAALIAGARLVQVRPEDHYTDRAAFDLATAIAALCDRYGAICLVNDRVHIAQAVGADGVHLGADDLPIDAARRVLPAASIIGGTARDPESARAARRAGATYLGVGPVWGTTTKAGLPQPIGLEGLAAVCAAVDLPVIAIGGITAERAALCREVGAHGVAVVGAVSAAADPREATAELLAAVGEDQRRSDAGSRRGAYGFGGSEPCPEGPRRTEGGSGSAIGNRGAADRPVHDEPLLAADSSAGRLRGSGSPDADRSAVRVPDADLPDTGLLRRTGEG